jgi:protease-4
MSIEDNDKPLAGDPGANEASAAAGSTTNETNARPHAGATAAAGASGRPVPPAGTAASPTGAAPDAAASGAADPTGSAPAAAPIAAPKPPKRKRMHGNGWKVAIVAIIAVAVVVICGIASCSSALSGAAGGLFGGSETQKASKPNTVAIITLDGTIGYDGTSCSPEGLKDLLDQAEDDSNVSAVVLRVNSGGGTSTAGEEMAGLVKKFSKPVVVSAASIDASAAYEISSQADYLYTAKSSEVGAIGTAMQVTNYKGLLDMLGIKADNIVSAKSKDSSYGTRPLTKKERAYYQKMVNQINDQFVSTVAEGRKMSKSQVKKLATGLPFTGMDAVKNGLFDEVGTLEDACKKASQLAGHGDNYDTMNLEGSSNLTGLSDLLGSDSDAGDSSRVSMTELKQLLKELEEHGVEQ